MNTQQTILRGTQRRYAVSGLLALTLLLFPGQVATAADSRSPGATPTVSSAARLASPRPVLAPIAFMRFCAHYPQDCQERRGHLANAAPLLNAARLTELVEINWEVNSLIVPQTDPGVTAEEWELSPRTGDCSDYAVTKRHQLLARGWPSSSLLLAEVVTDSGEHHLVLLVRMRGLDLVLDNLNMQVRVAAQTGYRWIRAQDPDNPKFWSTVDLIKPARVAVK